MSHWNMERRTKEVDEMRLLHLGFMAIISGFLLLILGGAQAGIFIVFPFIISSGIWGVLGAILIFTGFIMIFFDMISLRNCDYEDENIWKNAEKRGFGIVLIGPIPLIIDTKNRNLTLISALVFLILLTILFLIYLGALA